MPSTRTHDIYATVGRYKVEGRLMKRSIRVGTGFTDAQGRLYLRLDAMPCSPDWSGWLSVYPAQREPGEPRVEPPTDEGVSLNPDPLTDPEDGLGLSYPSPPSPAHVAHV